MFKRLALLSFCLLSQAVGAITVIHIAPYRFKRTQEKGIRMTEYDTMKRKLSAIRYYRNLSISLPNRIFQFNGKSVKVLAPLNNILICTSLKLDPGEYEVQQIELEQGAHRYVFPHEIQGKTIQAIKKVLSLIPSDGRAMLLGDENIVSKYEFDFSVKKYKKKDSVGFSNISGDQKSNSDERGLLGELAADLLALFDFGTSRLTSKHGGNHGWDAVYVAQNDGGLLVIESKNTKCGSAEKHFDGDYLSPKNSPIDKKKKINFLKKLDDLEYYGKGLQTKGIAKPELIKTREKIIDFLISKKPILLFLYRVMKDGSTGGCLVDIDDTTGKLQRDSLLTALALKKIPKPVTPPRIKKQPTVDIANLLNPGNEQDKLNFFYRFNRAMALNPKALKPDEKQKYSKFFEALVVAVDQCYEDLGYKIDDVMKGLGLNQPNPQNLLGLPTDLQDNLNLEDVPTGAEGKQEISDNDES